MTKNEFADGIKFIRNAFNLDPVRTEVLATWYSLGMQEIDSSEWKSIVKRISMTEERFPANFVRTVMAYSTHQPNYQKIERPPELSPEEEAANLARLKEIMDGIGVMPWES